MTYRYSLCRPVPGGYAFWAITDHFTNAEVVTVYREFPEAEHEIRQIFAKLIRVELPSAEPNAAKRNRETGG